MTELKAKFNRGNIKLGNMLTFSKLYGCGEYETEYGKVKGSCGGYCEGCKDACYVKKSYRYPSVIKSHARNTLAIETDINTSFIQLELQLNRMKKTPAVVRIHQSGELQSDKELINWLTMASNHPSIKFYLYTKAFDIVERVIGNNCVPSNFYINISVWHEYGIEEFKRLKNYPFIKAFVYMDGYNYKELKIETTCKAYDNGKMNHEITCDKCKKCFTDTFKVIGCKDH